MESGNSAKGGSSGKSVEAYGNKGYKVDKIYQSGKSGRICTKWLTIPWILQCWKKWIQLSPMTSFLNNYIFVTRRKSYYNISNDSIYKLPSCSLLLTEIFLVVAQTPLLHQTPTQFWVAEEAENKQVIHHQTMYIAIRAKMFI